jgi:uncharacterized protein
MSKRDEAPVGAPCWIELSTTDRAKAVAFYSALFGWDAEEPNADFGGYLNFSKDGVRVAGCMEQDGSMGPTDLWSIYLATDDIDKATEAARTNGGEVVVPPMALADLGSMAFLIDAGGAGVGLWQPGTHKGFQVIDEPGAPSWFELHTRDYEKSVAFYRDAFGWDTHTVGDEPDFRYTTLGEGEGQLAGIMDASAWLADGAPAQWSIYFQVADADAAVAKAVELGATVVIPVEDTPYGRLAQLADPTGAPFKLRQV